MSVQAITWAYRQTAPTPLGKFLLVTLGNYANEAYECWPSKARLAADLGCSESSVCRQLLQLQAAGLITVVPRVRDGVHLPSLIRLHVEGPAAPASVLTQEDAAGGDTEPAPDMVPRRPGPTATPPAQRRSGGGPAARGRVVPLCPEPGPTVGPEPSIEPSGDIFPPYSPPQDPLPHAKGARPTGGSATPDGSTRKPQLRGTRLDRDWQMPDDWKAWARLHFATVTPADIEFEADRFRDHWIAKTGQGATKLDWQATWRNWCRTAFGVRPATVRRRAPISPDGVQPYGRRRGVLDVLREEAAKRAAQAEFAP